MPIVAVLTAPEASSSMSSSFGKGSVSDSFPTACPPTTIAAVGDDDVDDIKLMVAFVHGVLREMIEFGDAAVSNEAPIFRVGETDDEFERRRPGLKSAEAETEVRTDAVCGAGPTAITVVFELGCEELMLA